MADPYYNVSGFTPPLSTQGFSGAYTADGTEGGRVAYHLAASGSPPVDHWLYYVIAASKWAISSSKGSTPPLSYGGSDASPDSAAGAWSDSGAGIPIVTLTGLLPGDPTADVRTVKSFDDPDAEDHPTLSVTSTIYRYGDLSADTLAAFEGQGYLTAIGNLVADTLAGFEAQGYGIFIGDMACDTLAAFTYLYWPRPTPSSDRTYERFRSKYQAEATRVSEARNLPWLEGAPASRITLGVFHALEADFADVKAAGLNTVLSAAWPNLLGQTIPSVLSACDAAGVSGVVILPTVPDSSLVASYDQHEALTAWYAQDEPNTKADWEIWLTELQGYLEDWAADKPIMVSCNYATADEYRDRFRAFLAESEIVCHVSYPYRYNLWPRAYTHESPTGLMVNGPIAQDIAETQGKEHWVILQAVGQNSIATGVAMPPTNFLRAQAYLSLILGATGLIWYCMDNWYIRSADLYGIAPDPPMDYGLGGLVISDAQAHGAQVAWEAIEEIAAEVSAYEEVWLSPTSSADYVVVYTAATYTWSRNPIQAVLKEYDGDYYLFLVNIENFPHGVTVYLTFEPTVETLFGPSATIAGQVLSVDLDEWGVWGGKLSV